MTNRPNDPTARPSSARVPAAAEARGHSVEAIAAAFADHDKAAALMPYLMGGFPTLDESRAIGLACADAGADLV